MQSNYIDGLVNGARQAGHMILSAGVLLGVGYVGFLLLALTAPSH